MLPERKPREFLRRKDVDRIEGKQMAVDAKIKKEVYKNIKSATAKPQRLNISQISREVNCFHALLNTHKCNL